MFNKILHLICYIWLGLVFFIIYMACCRAQEIHMETETEIKYKTNKYAQDWYMLHVLDRT